MPARSASTPSPRPAWSRASASSTQTDDDGRFWLTVPDGPVTVSVDGPGTATCTGAKRPTPYCDDAEVIEVDGGVRARLRLRSRPRSTSDLPPAVPRGTLGGLAPAGRRPGLHRRATHPRGRRRHRRRLSLVPPGAYFLQIESPQQCDVFRPGLLRHRRRRDGQGARGRGDAARVRHRGRRDPRRDRHRQLAGLSASTPTVQAYYGELAHRRGRVRRAGGLLDAAAGRRDLPPAGRHRRREALDRRRGLRQRDALPGRARPAHSRESPTRNRGSVCEIDPGRLLPSCTYDVVLRSATGMIYDSLTWRQRLQRSPTWLPATSTCRSTAGACPRSGSRSTGTAASPFADADPITIPAGGGVARVTMTLVRGAQVLGRMLDVDGEPLSTDNMFLMVYATTDSGTVTNLYTNWEFEDRLYDEDTGDYVLTQLRAGPVQDARAHRGQSLGLVARPRRLGFRGRVHHRGRDRPAGPRLEAAVLTPSEAPRIMTTRRCHRPGVRPGLPGGCRGLRAGAADAGAPRGGVIRGIVSDGAAIEAEFTVLAETVGAQDRAGRRSRPIADSTAVSS